MSKQSSQVPVILRQRVIVDDGLVFDAEREVTLPIEPFVGLVLYGTLNKPPDFDEEEEPIESIACELRTGRIYCYLRIDDFRPEASGSDDWTEADIREYFRDWTLTRDEGCRPRSERKRR